MKKALHDFPGPKPDSRTFQAWKMTFKFHDFQGSVQTLTYFPRQVLEPHYNNSNQSPPLYILLNARSNLIPSKTSVIWQICPNVAPLHHVCTTSIKCGRNDSTYASSSKSFNLASTLTRAIRFATSCRHTSIQVS